MRIAELIDVRTFRLTDAPLPEPAPGELRVRVGAVGLCGSDLHNYSEGSIGDAQAVYPMVLGHEPAGIIDKVGDGVTGWSVGDRVAMEPAIYCYHCEFCRSGRHNVCSNIRFMSMPRDPGFFRDYVTLPARNVEALPREMSLEEGAMIEPLAVALHSVNLSSVSAGESVAVFGAGPIGLLTIASLRVMGAGRIWSIDPVAHRRELALAMGADVALSPTDDLGSAIGPRGVDLAIDCAGKGGAMNQCLRVTRNAGRVTLTAIPSEVLVPIEFHVMRRKELTLLNVRRSNHDSEKALEMIHADGPRFRKLLTHTRNLSEIGDAFSMLESYSDGVGKMTIRFEN